ncbi:MAG: DUF721 domain-containing protein [bacterium]
MERLYHILNNFDEGELIRPRHEGWRDGRIDSKEFWYCWNLVMAGVGINAKPYRLDEDQKILYVSVLDRDEMVALQKRKDEIVRKLNHVYMRKYGTSRPEDDVLVEDICSYVRSNTSAMSPARWRETLAITEIARAWDSIVGRNIGKHARPVCLDRGILTVFVDHPTWLYQLEVDLKGSIVKAINDRIGGAIVGDIKFKVGRVGDIVGKEADSSGGSAPRLTSKDTSRIDEVASIISDEKIRRVFRKVMAKDLRFKRRRRGGDVHKG